MKDYEITRIWATEVAEISQMIDGSIDYMKARIETLETEDRLEDQWYQKEAMNLKEQIKAAEWALVQINAPFKLKK